MLEDKIYGKKGKSRAGHQGPRMWWEAHAAGCSINRVVRRSFIEKMTFELRLETGEGFSQRLLGTECSRKREQPEQRSRRMYLHGVKGLAWHSRESRVRAERYRAANQSCRNL